MYRSGADCNGSVYLVWDPYRDLCFGVSFGKISGKIRPVGAGIFRSDPMYSGSDPYPSGGYRLSGRCPDLWSRMGICI